MKFKFPTIRYHFRDMIRQSRGLIASLTSKYMGSSDPIYKLFRAIEEPKQEEKGFPEGELITIIPRVIDLTTEYLRGKAECTYFLEKIKDGTWEYDEIKVTTPLLSITFQLAVRVSSEGEIRVRLESDYVINEKAEKVLDLCRVKGNMKSRYISYVHLPSSKVDTRLTLEIGYREYNERSIISFYKSLIN